MQIIDGKKIRDKILDQIKKDVANLSFQPVFCDVLVGNDPASIQYVKMKARVAESVGVKFYEVKLPESISTEELIVEIKKVNEIKNMCGIIIQLPLPIQIEKQKVLDAVDPKLDVDCLGTINSEKFYKREYVLGFPTALACVYILDSLNIPLKNQDTGISKNIVVLGKGDLVGRPTTALLKARSLEVEVVTHSTEHKEKIIKEADVIISGMGKGKYLTGEMFKKDVIIIDAGTSESVECNSLGSSPAGDAKGELSSTIVGDVDLESVKNVASFVSPVPGGVGPVTLAMLLKNVLIVAKSIESSQNDFV